jgi:hypothetical protein
MKTLEITGRLQVNRSVVCATIHFSSKDRKAHADKTNDCNFNGVPKVNAKQELPAPFPGSGKPAVSL